MRKSVDNSKFIVRVDGFVRESVDNSKFIVRVDGFVCESVDNSKFIVREMVLCVHISRYIETHSER